MLISRLGVTPTLLSACSSNIKNKRDAAAGLAQIPDKVCCIRIPADLQTAEEVALATHTCLKSMLCSGGFFFFRASKPPEDLERGQTGTVHRSQKH